MRTSARPQRRLPPALAVAAGLAVAARLLGPSVQDRVAWVTPAAAESVATDRPRLYNFTAEWCGPCKRLERDLFADARSARWLGERFVPVRVVDREREDGANSAEVERLQARFSVQAFPTLMVVASDGTVLARHEGYAGNLRELRRALGEAASRPARR